MTVGGPTTTETSRPQAGRQGLTGKLGATSIILIVVAAASPLTVVAGSFPVGSLLGNGVGAPSMFVVVGVILLLFAVGLSAMSRFVPKPGAFFTYVGYGLGRPAGLAAAWLALLTYTAVQIAIYGFMGALTQGLIVELNGPDLPWWLYAVIILVCVGALGYRNIDISGRVLGVLLGAEVLIVVILVAAIVLSGGADGLNAEPFEWGNITSGVPSIGLMFAVGGFIGFESTAIFREEAKDPVRTIPRATYGAVIAIAVFYAISTWALVMGAGTNNLMGRLAEDPSMFTLVLADEYLGAAGSWAIRILTLTSMLACVLSFHNVISRYQHSMSAASALPTILGTVHARHGSPHTSSLVQSATALVIVAICALAGMDPVLQVFTWFAGVTTFAVVLLMALASVAVIAYLVRRLDQVGAWRAWIAPGLGLIGLLGAAFSIGVNFPLLIGDVNAEGVPQFGGLTLVFFGVIVLFPIIGLVQAAVMKRTAPEKYEGVIDTIGVS